MSSQLHHPDLTRREGLHSAARAPEGFFKRLNSAFDFRAIHQRFPLPYNPVPETSQADPSLLFKILLLEYLLDISNQEVGKELQASRELCQFLNVDDKDSLPAVEDVTIYRQRLGWIGFRRLYDRLLEDLEDRLSPLDMAVLEKRNPSQSSIEVAVVRPQSAEGTGFTRSSSRIKIVDPWAEPGEEQKTAQTKPTSSIETEQFKSTPEPQFQPPLPQITDTVEPASSNLSPAIEGFGKIQSLEPRTGAPAKFSVGETPIETVDVPSFLKDYVVPPSDHEPAPMTFIEPSEILRPFADLESTIESKDSPGEPPLLANDWMIAEMRVTERREEKQQTPQTPEDRSETDPLGIEAELDADLTSSADSIPIPSEEVPIPAHDEPGREDFQEAETTGTVGPEAERYLDFSSLAVELAASESGTTESPSVSGVSKQVGPTQEAPDHLAIADSKSESEPPAGAEGVPTAPPIEHRQPSETAEIAFEEPAKLHGPAEWPSLPDSSGQPEARERGGLISSMEKVDSEKPIFSSFSSITPQTTHLSREAVTKALYLAIPILVLLAVFLFIAYLRNSQSSTALPGTDPPSTANEVGAKTHFPPAGPIRRSSEQGTLTSSGFSKRGATEVESGIAGKSGTRPNSLHSVNSNEARSKQALLQEIRQKYQMDLSQNQYPYQDLKDIRDRLERELKKSSPQ